MIRSALKGARRSKQIVRAAERLVAKFKSMGGPGSGWYHRGCWYPMSCEKECRSLINAVLRRK